MRRLRLLWMGLAVAFAFGAIASAPAGAVTFLLAEWLVNGAAVVTELTTEAVGELSLEDAKAPLVGKAAVKCSVSLDGWIGASSLDFVKELLSLSGAVVGTLTSGTRLTCSNQANCSGTALVDAVNLGWETETELMEVGAESFFADLVLAHSGGNSPGWEIECTILGVKVVDECTAVEGVAKLVLSGAELLEAYSTAFTELAGSKLATCSQGGSEAGVVEGELTLKGSSGEITVSSGEGGGPTSTSLTTSLSGEGKEGETLTVLEGSKVKDKATLSGEKVSKATGKITYKVYSDSGCKTQVTSAGEVTVSSGSVPASSEEELEGGKSYYWQAHYSGDSENTESTSGCTEISSIKAKTTLTTKLSGESKEGEELTILEGSKAKDKATLSGTNSSTAGGKIVYKVFSDKECKTLVKEAGEVTVSSGNAPASNEEELEGGKAYYWQANYKGDSLHQESASICTSEVLNVKSNMTVSTELSGEGQSGSQIEVQESAKAHDTATLEGANVATASGSVQYDIYADSACTELVAKAGEGALESGGKAPASAEEKLVNGLYYWQATYSGDSTHTAASSPCNSEIEVVAEDTSLTTILRGEIAESETSEGAELIAFEGGAIEDSATLSGVNAPLATGTIAYNVYSDSECKELVASAGEMTVTGGSAPPSASMPLPPGTYYWQAAYSGDSLNKPSKSACGTEVEKVVPAPITTSLAAEGQSGAQITVQEAAGVRDTATLHEEHSSTATGEVTYKVYSDSECKKLVAEAGKVTLEAGGKIPASGEEKLATGTYYWQATYSGDLSHASGTSPCGAEVDTVAESTILTTSLAGEGKEGAEIEVHEGSQATDSATLSGTDSSLATGAVIYSIYSDSECKELFAEGGAGSVTSGVPTSSSEVALPAGTYYWQATYFGDALNQSSTSTCGSEVEKVTTAALTSSLSGGGETGTDLELDEETAVTDTATLHEENASTATGKVIYTVYSNSECTTPLAEAGEVTVSEGKIPASSPETLGEGTYYWQAHYTGDGSHKEATSLCSQAVQNVDRPWIISVGDSYISGEGARRAGNNEERSAREASLITALPNAPYWGRDNNWIGNDETNQEAIPGCHRSKSAEIMIGQDEAGRGVLGRNIACSGAETTSISQGGAFTLFTPGLDFANAGNGQLIDPARRGRGRCGLTRCRGQATQLQEFASNNRGPIKMVAISIGGDNFGFKEIVEACVKAFISPRWNKPCSETQAAKFERASMTAREGEIEAGINNIGRALENGGYRSSEFTLLVQDYPSPIPEPAGFRFTETERTGRWWNVTKRAAAGCEITNADATWINGTVVPKVNEAVKNVVKNIETAGRYKVVFLELESALNGHRLCEAGLKFVGEGTPPYPPSGLWPGAATETEWVAPIRVSPARPFGSRESLHPNYWGQLALRNCLRQVYNNGTPLNGKKCVLRTPQGIRQAWTFQTGGGMGLLDEPDAWRSEPLMRLE